MIDLSTETKTYYNMYNKIVIKMCSNFIYFMHDYAIPKLFDCIILTHTLCYVIILLIIKIYSRL